MRFTYETYAKIT